MNRDNLQKSLKASRLFYSMAFPHLYSKSYNPDEPRDSNGRWTSGLSTAKVGNVIFNETRSLSSMQGSNINDARENITHMIRNGEDWADANGTLRPRTANDFIGNVPSVENQTYMDSQAAATKVDQAISAGQSDPTKGAIYMSIVGDNHTILNGKTLTVSTGPFHNSFPNKDVPAKTVYINFSK